MKDALLTQIPYYILMLCALTTAAAAGLGAWTGARPRWFWLEAAGLGLVGVALALLVIVSGPAPQLSGPGVSAAYHILLWAGGVLWAAWCCLYVPHIVRVRRRHST